MQIVKYGGYVFVSTFKTFPKEQRVIGQPKSRWRIMFLYYFHIYLCDNVVQHAFNMQGLGLFCFACWFILDDVPTRQEKAAKGNLTACLKTQENLTGCLLNHSTCCYIQSWVHAMNLGSCASHSPVSGLSCHSLLLAHSKGSKKLYKYTHTHHHPSPEIPASLWGPWGTVTHVPVRVHVCTLPPWVQHSIPKYWAAAGRGH